MMRPWQNQTMMVNVKSNSASVFTLVLAVLALAQTGCVTGIAAHRVPAEIRGPERNNREPINIMRLRQDPPPVYQLAARDILGIYIEGVLGNTESAPPVHFPEDATQPPAIGFPIPVREDGMISLPFLEPVPAQGRTLAQLEDDIRRRYIEGKILQKGKDRIIVTLLRPREYQVLVVRETTNQVLQEGAGNPISQGTREVQLKAYENDVLHALIETGGLPGEDYENEVYILRGLNNDAAKYDALSSQIRSCVNRCGVHPPLPDDPTVTAIPLRVCPGEVVNFSQEDIILKTGDVLYIKSREREVFYTGGLLGGGQHLLPRDYDLDILGAISRTGGSFAQTFGGNPSNAGGQGGSFNLAPTRALIIRNLPCGGQVIIKVNLNRALTNPRERVIIQPEDIIVLEYTPFEFVANQALRLFQFNFLFGLNGFR